MHNLGLSYFEDRLIRCGPSKNTSIHQITLIALNICQVETVPYPDIGKILNFAARLKFHASWFLKRCCSAEKVFDATSFVTLERCTWRMTKDFYAWLTNSRAREKCCVISKVDHWRLYNVVCFLQHRIRAYVRVSETLFVLLKKWLHRNIDIVIFDQLRKKSEEKVKSQKPTESQPVTVDFCLLFVWLMRLKLISKRAKARFGRQVRAWNASLICWQQIAPPIWKTCLSLCSYSA